MVRGFFLAAAWLLVLVCGLLLQAVEYTAEYFFTPAWLAHQGYAVAEYAHSVGNALVYGMILVGFMSVCFATRRRR